MKSKSKRAISLEERDRHGKLLSGHSGLPGAGRPPKKVEDRYLLVSYKNCSLKAWGRIVRRAVKDASRGDASARTWLSKQLGLENMKLNVVLQNNEKPPLDLSLLSTAELTELLELLKRGTPQEAEDEETGHSKLH
jgi:hypothetical protein